MHCANSVLIRRTKGIVGTRGRNAAPQPLIIIIIIKMKFIIINLDLDHNQYDNHDDDYHH